MLADWVYTTTRASSFIAMLQACGAATFLVLFGRRLDASRRVIRQLGGIAVVSGIVLASAHYALEAARMAGALSGVFDASLQELASDTTSATALIIRLAGLGLIGIALWSRHALHLRVLALLGTLLVSASFTATGHTSVHSQRVWLGLLLSVHVWVAAFWFGALAPLRWVVLRETPDVAGALIEQFSRTATALVPLIALAGVAMAIVLLPGWHSFVEPYGILLLVKIAGFCILMALAAANKWLLGPAIVRGEAGAAHRFLQSVAAEGALIVVVLIATATLTSFFSPEV